MKIQDLLTGAFLAAGTSYLLDPDGGRRRRARVKDKIMRTSHQITVAAHDTRKDLAHRAIGAVNRTFSILRRSRVHDQILQERIQSQLGHLVSHPNAIHVDVHEGTAILAGPILRDEMDLALKSISKIKGIWHIENNLEAHKDPSNVAGLQGPAQSAEEWDSEQQSWIPGTRIVLGSLGGLLFLRGFRNGGPIRTPLAFLGAGLFIRAVTNRSLRRLMGIGVPPAVQLIQSISISAPVDKVYDLWSQWDRFPEFMRHVRRVEKTQEENQWRWVVDGPAGIPMEWTAVVTDNKPNKSLAWKTVGKSLIQHSGTVYFNSLGSGMTEVDVRFYFNPLGRAGEAVAKFFGSDPESQIKEDLINMKTILETESDSKDTARMPFSSPSTQRGE